MAATLCVRPFKSCVPGGTGCEVQFTALPYERQSTALWPCFSSVIRQGNVCKQQHGHIGPLLDYGRRFGQLAAAEIRPSLKRAVSGYIASNSAAVVQVSRLPPISLLSTLILILPDDATSTTSPSPKNVAYSSQIKRTR